MAAAPAVAPAVAIAGLISASLFTLACFLVLYGLLKGYQWTLGALLTELADKVRGVRWVGGKVADALEGIDEAVVDSIGAGVLASQEAMGKFWAGIAWIWEQTINAILELGRSTADALDGVQSAEIPNAITTRTREIVREVYRGDLTARARARAIDARATAGIDRLTRDLAAEKLRSERGIDALDAKLGRAIEGARDYAASQAAGARAWAGTRLRGLDARIATVTGLIAAGALTAAGIRALDRNFPWWKCTNVRRFNRQLCRAPLGALDDLFGLALAIVGSLSILELARELQGLMPIATGAVHEWIVED